MRALAVAFALAACSAQPAQTPAPPARVMTIGPDGAGGLAAPLAFTRDAVSAAAPGFDVSESGEGDARRIVLSADGAPVFTLAARGDKVGEITTRSAAARGPANDRIGVSKFGEAPAIEVLYCASQSFAAHPGFACAATRDARFWRLYVLPQDYHGVTQPFASIDPDHALNATLAEMRWIAPED